MTSDDISRVICGHAMTHGAAETLEAVRVGLLRAHALETSPARAARGLPVRDDQQAWRLALAGDLRAVLEARVPPPDDAADADNADNAIAPTGAMAS